MREYSYVNDILPELIWLGLIHDHAGYHLGGKILRVVVETTKGLEYSKKNCNFALQMAYADLPHEVKSNILLRCQQEDILETLRFALAPLILLYDECPLSFFGPPSSFLSEPYLISRIKACVANHLDKSRTPGVVLHGSLLLTRLMSGTIKFAQHIQVPDFNKVITEPDSDDAKLAASFMRANAGAEWAMLDISNKWAKHFWNRNAQLSPCETPKFGGEDE